MPTTQCNVNPDTSEIAIGGYSPVSYFEKGQAELGSPDHAVEHDSKVYHFTSAEQAKMFPRHPGQILAGARRCLCLRRDGWRDVSYRSDQLQDRRRPPAAVSEERQS